MQCMKTGITFQISPMSATYHGDMYYCQDLNCLLIRGLAPGASDQKPNVILERCIDTFTLLEASLDFQIWWQTWNPSVQLQGTIIIIADSRF